MDSDRAQVKRLGDFVALQRGNTYKSSLLGQPGPVLLGLATIQRNGGFRCDSLRTYGGDSPAKLTLRPGDLYVSLKDVTQAGDLLGAVSRVPESVPVGRLTQDTVRLDLVDGAPDSAYLYWLLRTRQYRAYCRARAIGTTNLSLGREDFLAFPVPPLTDTRRTLVAVLENTESKIELNRRMNQTLESVARAIFRSWFVDFDPVRKKMEGKTGGELGPAPSLAALYPAALDEAGVPVGWTRASLSDIAEQVREQVLPGEMDPDTPYFGLEHLPRRSIALGDWGRCEGLASSKWRLARGDILFGKLRPYFHKVGPAPLDGVCSTDILVIRPRRADFAGFLEGHLSSDELVGYAAARTTGTRMPRTSWKDLSAYPLVLPPASVVAAYESTARPLLKRIMHNVLESRALTDVRDALLPRLLSGELRADEVEDADEPLREAPA